MNISLALGGGGSKGNAHLGVIRALEREGFRIRAIAGTSYGGIVGVFYALGYSIDEIEQLFSGVDQARLYRRAKSAKTAIFDLIGGSAWLEKTLADRTFEDLKIPCALTAADLESGREIILTRGLLRDAIMATSALPGIFPVRSVDGLSLVDGAVVDPVPVAVARSLAPRLPVVAVVLSRPIGAPAKHVKLPVPRQLPRVIKGTLQKSRFVQVFDVFMRAVEIGGRQLAELHVRLEKPDVIIRPDVQDIDLLDKVDIREVARLGEAAVAAARPQLRNLMPWSRRFGRSRVQPTE